jgi:tetratricopeptide (TPR) repeat protein
MAMEDEPPRSLRITVPTSARRKTKATQQRVSIVSAIPSEDLLAPSTWQNGRPQGLRSSEREQYYLQSPTSSTSLGSTTSHSNKRPDGHDSLVPSEIFFAPSNWRNGRPQGRRQSERIRQEYPTPPESLPISMTNNTPRQLESQNGRKSLVPSERMFAPSEWANGRPRGIRQSELDRKKYSVSPVLDGAITLRDFQVAQGSDLRLPSAHFFDSLVPRRKESQNNSTSDWDSRADGANLASKVSCRNYRLPESHNSLVPSENFFRPSEWLDERPRGFHQLDWEGQEHGVRSPSRSVTPRPDSRNSLVPSNIFFRPDAWTNGDFEDQASSRQDPFALTLEKLEASNQMHAHLNQVIKSRSHTPHEPLSPVNPERSEFSFQEGGPPVPNTDPQRRFSDFTGTYAPSNAADSYDLTNEDSGTIIIYLDVASIAEKPIHLARPSHLQPPFSPTLVEANPLSSPQILHLWSHAMLLFKNYELEQSLQLFRRIRLHIPRNIRSFEILNSALLWANNGLIRYHLGDYYRASKDLRKACLIEPASSIFWFFLGTILWELDLWRRALLHFNTAMALFPDGVEVLDYRERGLDYFLDKVACRWNRMMAWYWIQWKKHGSELPEEFRGCGIVRCPGGKLFGPTPVQ